jgi:hypothetical protein
MSKNQFTNPFNPLPSSAIVPCASSIYHFPNRPLYTNHQTMPVTELSLTKLTLEDSGDEKTFSDDFLRAACGQESRKFKFRRKRETEYTIVEWETRDISSPSGDAVTYFVLWPEDSEWLRDCEILVKIDIDRFAGLLMERFPEWLDLKLTKQDRKIIWRARVSNLINVTSALCAI